LTALSCSLSLCWTGGCGGSKAGTRRIKGRDEEGGVGEADDATQRGDADEVVHAQDEKNEKSADTRRTTSASTLTPPFEDGRSFTVSSDETVLSVSDRHRVKE
jgi:hypothetical protein